MVTVYPGLTATEFSDNIIDKENADRETWKKMKPQSAAFVAGKIVRAAIREPRTQYMGLSSRILAVVGVLAPGFLERQIIRRMK